jgi:hypothetical protein
VRELASVACPFDPKVLIMLSVYCGDSGMVRGSTHCFLGGYIANADRWANFSDKWQELCEKHLGGKSLRLNPDHPFPSSVLMEFAECIVDHVETEIWTAAPEYYLKKRDVQYDKYRLCFLGLLDATTKDYGVRKQRDHLTWWFGHPEGSGNDPYVDVQVSLYKAFLDAKSLLGEENKRLLDSICFADENSLLPLQAARFLVDLKSAHWSAPDGTPEPPALTILRGAEAEDKGAKLHRVGLVWLNHMLEDELGRLGAAEK